MEYFDIKLKLKNDSNQLTCCYLTSVKDERDLLNKKLACIKQGTSLDDYVDETEKLTVEQAIEKVNKQFIGIITRKYKIEHLGLNDHPAKDVLDLMKRDLTNEELFDALMENNIRLNTIDILMKRYDISKISAREFFEIVDKFVNAKDEEEGNKILSKLKKYNNKNRR